MGKYVQNLQFGTQFREIVSLFRFKNQLGRSKNLAANLYFKIGGFLKIGKDVNLGNSKQLRDKNGMEFVVWELVGKQ